MSTEIQHDSRPDTLAHIARVAELLKLCEIELNERACAHDESKLEEPEKSAFDRLKGLSLSGMAYGSEEYRACLRAEKPAIQHHYKANSHHPEFYPKREGLMPSMLRVMAITQEAQAGDVDESNKAEAEVFRGTAKFLRDTADHLEAEINGMSLFDVIEMLMDWKAATERMKDGGDIRKSLEINRDRFKISPQLESIISNTIKEMGW